MRLDMIFKTIYLGHYCIFAAKRDAAKEICPNTIINNAPERLIDRALKAWMLHPVSLMLPYPAAIAS